MTCVPFTVTQPVGRERSVAPGCFRAMNRRNLNAGPGRQLQPVMHHLHNAHIHAIKFETKPDELRLSQPLLQGPWMVAARVVAAGCGPSHTGGGLQEADGWPGVVWCATPGLHCNSVTVRTPLQQAAFYVPHRRRLMVLTKRAYAASVVPSSSSSSVEGEAVKVVAQRCPQQQQAWQAVPVTLIDNHIGFGTHSVPTRAIYRHREPCSAALQLLLQTRSGQHFC